MAFCTQLKIFENLLVLASGKATDLYNKQIQEEWCTHSWSVANWLSMITGVLVIAVMSTIVAAATKSAARLVWHRLPDIDDIVPTRYFWVKIFGRRPIRQSGFYDSPHQYSPAKITESTSKIIRTMNTERHGPSEHSATRPYDWNKYRPIAK